jgi:DNA mismatch endonuclease (patch repair protein)
MTSVGTGIGDAGEELLTTALGFTTTPARSAMMRKIKAKNTKGEVLLAKALWASGARYRRHYKLLPGKPDLVFTKQKLVVFIDGEFWHGYQWEERKQRLLNNLEGNRQKYWVEKIERNMARDRRNEQAIKEAGWTVLRYWHRQVIKDVAGCVADILQHVREPRF